MSTNAIVPTRAPIALIVDGQLVQGQEYTLSLVSIQHAAFLIPKIDTKDMAQEARELCKRAQDEMNAIIAAAEPERLRLQAQIDELRRQVLAMVAPFQEAVDRIDRESRAWIIEDERRAKAEEARANKGKPVSQQITVAPNRPRVPGTRFVKHWRWKLISLRKMNRHFLMPDGKLISKTARDDQDPEKTERKVGKGSIKVWAE